MTMEKVKRKLERKSFFFKRIITFQKLSSYPGFENLIFFLLLFFYCNLVTTEIIEGESNSNPLLFREIIEPMLSPRFPEEEKGGNSRLSMNNSDSSSHIYEIVVTQVEVKGFTQVYKNTQRPTTIDLLERKREKRGYFAKDEEKQLQQEEFDRSFRLFWFLGGVAIIFFIGVFILTLLCLCCPAMKNRRKETVPLSSTIPRISTSAEPDLDAVLYPPSDFRIDIEGRVRSPSVYSANAMYLSHHRLSQEQVNAIQIQSQSRRSSAINMAPPMAMPMPIPSTSQGLSPASALIDVSVVQEQRPETTITA